MSVITYTDADGTEQHTERDEYHTDDGTMLVAYNKSAGTGVEQKIAIPINRVVTVVD